MMQDTSRLGALSTKLRKVSHIRAIDQLRSSEELHPPATTPVKVGVIQVDRGSPASCRYLNMM